MNQKLPINGHGMNVEGWEQHIYSCIVGVLLLSITTLLSLGFHRMYVKNKKKPVCADPKLQRILLGIQRRMKRNRVQATLWAMRKKLVCPHRNCASSFLDGHTTYMAVDKLVTSSYLSSHYIRSKDILFKCFTNWGPFHKSHLRVFLLKPSAHQTLYSINRDALLHRAVKKVKVKSREHVLRWIFDKGAFMMMY